VRRLPSASSRTSAQWDETEWASHACLLSVVAVGTDMVI
jgi:hypothetical protein